MQSKILFFLFFIIVCSKSFADEQFIFNISKIEILENGNKIIGTDRGIISSDNGINIEANNFEYTKKDNILNVYGDVVIKYPDKNYVIYAENISYLKNKNILRAKNNIKLFDNNKIISSNNLLFDINKNIFKATGNVEIIDNIKDYNVKSEDITYIKNEEKIISKGFTNSYLNKNYNFKSNEELIINLLDSTLKASGDVEFIDSLKNNKIVTNEINYFEKDEKIITKGKTNAEIHNRFILKSESIYFSNKIGIIKSKNKASLNDLKNDSYYEIKNFELSLDTEILKGENISINTDYSKPINDKYFIKSGIFDLKNKSFVTRDIDIYLKKNLFNNEKNDPRLKGVSSSSNDGITIINKGIFTSCNKDENDCPPWSLQAEKIEYDENKKLITYDNALLKVYDKPIFYFPKFFHPGPTVKRQSGFLAPRFGNSKILGSSIQIPYFIANAENYDFTFSPSIYDKNIFRIQNEFRLQNKNSSFIADLSITEGYKSKTNKDKNSITHLFSKYNSDFNLENFSESSLEISLQKVNNDTYLKIFDQESTSEKIKPQNNDLLTSEVKINLKNERYNLITGITSYENLQKSNNDRYEFILPYYNLSGELNNGKEYGYLGFSSIGSNVLKNTNNLRSKIINDFDFRSFDIITESGIQNNINIYLKNLIATGKNDEDYNSSIQNDLMSIIEFSSALPLVKTNDNSLDYLEPKISFRYNPSSMINHSNTSRKININNLFDINRLGLEDTLESGTNLTLGINYKKENLDDINKYFEFKVGTILRNEENNNIPSSSGIVRKKTNIFGSINKNINENFSINYDFSVNHDLDKVEYNSFGLMFAKNNFKTEFNFIEENGVIGDNNIIENISSFNFDDKNKLSFKTRQNRKLGMAEYYNLIYEYKNDCLVAGINYNKTYYEDRDLMPSEDILFKITLIPITTLSQSISN